GGDRDRAYAKPFDQWTSVSGLEYEYLLAAGSGLATSFRGYFHRSDARLYSVSERIDELHSVFFHRRGSGDGVRPAGHTAPRLRYRRPRFRSGRLFDGNRALFQRGYE